MAKDPVCGMTVDENDAAGTSEYQGQTYYFCSKGCKVTFDKEPEKYLKQQPDSTSATGVAVPGAQPLPLQESRRWPGRTSDR